MTTSFPFERWRPVLLRLALHAALLAALPIGGCKKGSPPQLMDPGDQVAVVGQTLTVQLFATDADGDPITFDFHADGVPDLSTTTSLTVAPDGHGVFTITPLASQVGTHIFDFVASDGKHHTVLPISIEIKGAVGSGSVPVFRKPLGQGTVLDLDQNDCEMFDIEVEDPDSPKIDLSIVPPTIKGSKLDAASDGLTGSWSWCPTREQTSGQDRYDLTLSADDGDNPPTLKDYLVVLRKRSGSDCPGDPPQITHTPQDFSTLLDLDVEAQVTDDMGLKNPPIVLYSDADPGTPVDFSKLSVVEMELTSGDMKDGKWKALVPNPTADQGMGATAKLYYIIEATDNDDPMGDCDHRTDDPADGVFTVNVTNNGMGGGAPCDSCSFDVQCGGDGDLCLQEGNANVCGKACTSQADCDSDYVCSPDPVSSVDGASGRQCIPNSGSCGGSGGACQDDSGEDDDNPAEAEAIGAIAPGDYQATLCPMDDDWWLVQPTAKAQIQAQLSGANPPDMDLALTDSDGVLIDQSNGLTSDETITSACLDPGQYLLRVFSVAPDGNHGDYTLSFSFDTDTCASGMGTGDCCSAHTSPGCMDSTVQMCVCGMDSFCCDNQWDDLCAGKAQSQCGACGGGGTNQDCCTAQMTPGCTDATVQACVCATDPYCCGNDMNSAGVWDSTCVSEVGSTLCAPACTPDDGDGPCCMDNGTTGCEINSVESCVCAMDMLCCTSSWDSVCVGEIDSFSCGTCPS